jgi:LuxR family maltose regulon positive regulatory protein
MPKAAQYTVRWSGAHQAYGVFAQYQADPLLLCGDETAWLAWLEAHSCFSFHGSAGTLSLQKERRARGKAGYWYAYRRQGRRMLKRYLGSSRKLTPTQLEAVAQVPGGQTLPSNPSPFASRSSETRQHKAIERAAPATARVEVSRVRRASVSSLSSEASLPGLLLLAKLRPPRLPSHLIPRKRLHALLDSGLQRKLTLVTAPAGYGKTTLITQWVNDPASSAQLFPVAWVSFEPEDNDPVRFWRYVLTACQIFQKDLGRSSLAHLLAGSSSFVPPDLRAVLTVFLNDVTQLNCPGVLILEDYHVITSSQIHEMITFLVDHLPESLHLVILTRNPSALPLLRWRSRDDLVEVGVSDLSFTPQETHLFLQHLLPDHAALLSTSLVADLHARLEGWVTGLRLLTLALSGRREPGAVEHALTSLAGNEWQIQDYLVTEVLSVQPEEVQTFLLQSSLFPRLTASLCDTAMGRSDSEQVLQGIANAGLFLQPLEGGESWYRYHALFAQAMQACARRRLGTEVVHACLSRASLWYEQRGMLPAAVEAALQASDFARAVALIEALIGPQHWIALQEFQTVQRWLSQLPEPVLYSSPALCFFSATLLTFDSPSDRLAPSTFARVETLLQRAEQSKQQSRSGPAPEVLLAFRALLALRQGAIKEADRLSRQALPSLSQEQPTWLGICLGIVAEEERWLGQLEAARNDLLTVLSLFDATRNQAGKLVTVLVLAEVCTEQGALYQASELYHTARSWAGRQRADCTKALIGLAQLAYEWNDLDQAAQLLQEAAEHLSHFTDEALQAQATLLQARILQASGQTEQARRLLQALLAWRDPSHSPQLLREILFWQTHLELSCGNLLAAQRWAPLHQGPDEHLSRLQYEREEQLLARWLLAQGRGQEALGLLEGWYAEAMAAGRIRSALESQLLSVLAYHQLNHSQDAHRLLTEVVQLAHTQGYLRLFLDEGEDLAALLRLLVPSIGRKPLRTYLQTILFASDQAQAKQQISDQSVPCGADFSPQEQRVLALLVAGHSRQEIAEKLVISLNTVKTHLQRIYQKLQVTNRDAARLRARELHLYASNSSLITRTIIPMGDTPGTSSPLD